MSDLSQHLPYLVKAGNAKTAAAADLDGEATIACELAGVLRVSDDDPQSHNSAILVIAAQTDDDSDPAESFKCDIELKEADDIAGLGAASYDKIVEDLDIHPGVGGGDTLSLVGLDLVGRKAAIQIKVTATHATTGDATEAAILSASLILGGSVSKPAESSITVDRAGDSLV